MPVFIHNGLKLHYEVKGEGRPLVFLHGMGGSVSQIDAVFEPREGVRLIIPDQQGHGESEADWDSLDFDRLGDDAAALLDHLGLERACFAGISMGAAVSLNVAVRYPRRVESLLLIRNAWTDRPMEPKARLAYRDLGLALSEGGVEAFRRSEGFRIVEQSGSDYTMNAFQSPFSDPVCVRNWRNYLILPKQTPVADAFALQGLGMPVSILANRNDLCHPFSYGEYLRDRIPHARFQEIPDKDRDAAIHKAMVNRAAGDMMGLGRL